MDGITSMIDISFSKLWELVIDREGWCAAVHGIWVSDWTEMKGKKMREVYFSGIQAVNWRGYV